MSESRLPEYHDMHRFSEDARIHKIVTAAKGGLSVCFVVDKEPPAKLKRYIEKVKKLGPMLTVEVLGELTPGAVAVRVENGIGLAGRREKERFEEAEKLFDQVAKGEGPKAVDSPYPGDKGPIAIKILADVPRKVIIFEFPTAVTEVGFSVADAQVFANSLQLLIDKINATPGVPG